MRLLPSFVSTLVLLAGSSAIAQTNYPDAPGWFKITNCWPILSAIFCVTILAATSTALAAARGTIILIGRSG